MGCANSLILLELHRNGLLLGKSIVVYEPAQKIANDRTFCFWLEPAVLETTGLDQLVSHSWSRVKCNEAPPQLLEGKRYYYLRSDALYTHTTALLSQYNVTFHRQTLQGFPNELAHFIFDSRSPQFDLNTPLAVELTQSFFGWLVKTDKPIFDSEVFTMMDFSIVQNGHTQFLYVLPFDAQQALIEPTRFGHELMTEQEATGIIENYLEQYHTRYQIIEKEQGSIPMCSAALQNQNLPLNWFRTGAGGGQLKPSTGYSFVRSLTDAQHIVQSIRSKEKKFRRRKSPVRFAYYDRLLLQIIGHSPARGKQIFTQLFQHNRATKVLSFLDEKSTLLEEVRLMSSLPIALFLGAALKDVLLQLNLFFRQRSWAIYMSILLLLLQYFKLSNLGNALLLMGLLWIGIPHGALDHLYTVSNKMRIPWRFIGVYISFGLVVLLLWWLFPTLALLGFLLYTAWHFGQADFEHWKKPDGLQSFMWGIGVVGVILLGHWPATKAILSDMNIHVKLDFISALQPLRLNLLIGFWLACALLVGRGIRLRLVETMLMLYIGIYLPLLAAFACYFIFQHSWHGWQHLRNKLSLNNTKMWRKAMPFTLGAIGLFGLYLWLVKEPNWGQAFIFLSALSFPHVWFMHKSYQKTKAATLL